jgi:phosphopantothenate-cysteine ligase
MLAPLVKHWVPGAFVVSFKLETDENLLIKKAKKALDTYQHRIVVANLLHSRKERVILVTRDDLDDQEESIVMSHDELANGSEIEEKIVANLRAKHIKLINSNI